MAILNGDPLRFSNAAESTQAGVRRLPLDSNISRGSVARRIG